MELTNVRGRIKGDTYYIYVIECTANKKKYVGRTRTPRTREMSHINDLKGNRHYNSDLQNDFNKYGESAFTFEIIDTSLHEVNNPNNKESLWMRRLKTYDPRYGYNNNDVKFMHGVPAEPVSNNQIRRMRGFGKMLRNLRGNKSADEVAAEIGISRSAIAMYESERRIPKDDVKMKLANYYKRSVQHIFYSNTKEGAG